MWTHVHGDFFYHIWAADIPIHEVPTHRKRWPMVKRIAAARNRKKRQFRFSLAEFPGLKRDWNRRNRAEKRLHMSRNCSEKLGPTTSRPILGKCSRMKLWCSKDISYPCYRTVCSESSKFSCSSYVVVLYLRYPIDEIDNRWQSISINTNRYQLIDWYW